MIVFKNNPTLHYWRHFDVVFLSPHLGLKVGIFLLFHDKKQWLPIFGGTCMPHVRLALTAKFPGLQLNINVKTPGCVCASECLEKCHKIILQSCGA